MKVDIYCDESGPEALVDKNAHKYAGIGSIRMPFAFRKEFKYEMNKFKQKHGVNSELKWKKLSPKYYDLYKEIIDFFFISDMLKFRVILLKSEDLNHSIFNCSDAELGFYKFYYEMLKHKLFEFNHYKIFLDYKENRDKERLNVLQKCLSRIDNINIEIVQALESYQSLGIQLADILTGLVTSKFNAEISPDSVKLKLIKYIEEKYLEAEIKPTDKEEDKFNIFSINLQNKW
jgi:hypothetical protein